MPSVCIDSPVGPVTITEEHGYLTSIRFGAIAPDASTPLLDHTRDQLRRYFAGTLFDFDVPLAPATSKFQGQLRQAMLAIPYAGMRTYGDIARELSSDARAIGQGCGANPLPIIVPCHRVIAANGRLGGFSAGKGRETKRKLLNHEAVHAP